VTAYAHDFETAAPALLHMSKVAVGCATLNALRKRQELRAAGGEVTLVTRFMPKRASELIGGSLYWIVKHQLVARQRIVGFAQRPADRRTVIRLDAELIAVRAAPKRAHQGWRYLEAADAPADRGGGDEGLEELPGDLMRRLSALALI
jgi:hypothetical protein